MLNVYQPFPRFENAIFVGDTAIRVMAQLGVYAKAHIGGDLPNMKFRHPYAKSLECIYCAMHDRRAILDTAARKEKVDYILLEDNGLSRLNPVAMKRSLREEGFVVRVLNVTKKPDRVLWDAAVMTSRTAQARRVWRDYLCRQKENQKKERFAKARLLILLGVRHPVTDQGYTFQLTLQSTMARALCRLGDFRIITPQCSHRLMPGVTDVMDEIPRIDAIDVVGLTGRIEPIQEYLQQKNRLDLLQKSCVLAFYDRPLFLRKSRMLARWYQALRCYL